MIEEASPIFVVGPPRSGTTLVASMLGAHPDIWCGPETQLYAKFPDWLFRGLRWMPFWPWWVSMALRRVTLSDQKVTDLYDTSTREVVGRLRVLPRSSRSVLLALMEGPWRKSGKAVWAEKTPSHVEHLSRIMNDFPAAKVLFIVRDPRDSIPSMAQLPWCRPSLAARAWVWRAAHESFLAWQKEASESTWTILRYEDLLNDPAGALSRTMDNLGLSYSAEMLSFTSAASSVKTAFEPWKSKNGSALDPGRAFAWKRTSRPETSEIVGQLLSDCLGTYGYDCEAPNRVLHAKYFNEDVVEALAPCIESLARVGTVLSGSTSSRGDVVAPSPMLFLRTRRPARAIVEILGILRVWLGNDSRRIG